MKNVYADDVNMPVTQHTFVNRDFLMLTTIFLNLLGYYRISTDQTGLVKLAHSKLTGKFVEHFIILNMFYFKDNKSNTEFLASYQGNLENTAIKDLIFSFHSRLADESSPL